MAVAAREWAGHGIASSWLLVRVRRGALRHTFVAAFQEEHTGLAVPGRCTRAGSATVVAGVALLLSIDVRPLGAGRQAGSLPVDNGADGVRITSDTLRGARTAAAMDGGTGGSARQADVVLAEGVVGARWLAYVQVADMCTAALALAGARSLHACKQYPQGQRMRAHICVGIKVKVGSCPRGGCCAG